MWKVMMVKLNGYIFWLKMMTYQKNTIWDKVSSDIKKEFDSETVYYKKVLKTKIKSYGDEATGFHDEEMPKLRSNNTCSAVINVYSDLKKDKNYFLQVFLKECKCIEKEKMWLGILRII